MVWRYHWGVSRALLEAAAGTRKATFRNRLQEVVELSGGRVFSRAAPGAAETAKVRALVDEASARTTVERIRSHASAPGARDAAVACSTSASRAPA